MKELEIVFIANTYVAMATSLWKPVFPLVVICPMQRGGRGNSDQLLRWLDTLLQNLPSKVSTNLGASQNVLLLGTKEPMQGQGFTRVMQHDKAFLAFFKTYASRHPI